MNSVLKISIEIGIILVAITLLIFAYRKSTKYFSFLKEKCLKLKLKESKLVSTEQGPQNFIFIPRLGVTIISLSETIFKILLILVTLTVTIEVLPQTESFSLGALISEWIWHPIFEFLKEIALYIPTLFRIIIILGYSYYLTKICKIVFNGIEDQKYHLINFDPSWARPTRLILTLVIWVLAVALVVPHLPGAGSPAFKGVTLGLGALFSFGSASSVSNLVSGIVLNYLNLLRKGDLVEIGGQSGVVTEAALFVTRIKDHLGVISSIPNAEILKTTVKNYSKSDRSGEVAYSIRLSVSYDYPWRDVEKELLAATENIENIQIEPTPHVTQRSLDPFSASYELIFYIKNPLLRLQTTSKVNLAIRDNFDRAGIKIHTPNLETPVPYNNG